MDLITDKKNNSENFGNTPQWRSVLCKCFVAVICYLLCLFFSVDYKEKNGKIVITQVNC